jgi:hypothetical protein
MVTATATTASPLPVGVSTFLAVLGLAAPAIQDAMTIYNLAAAGWSAADLATAQAALTAMQGQCSTDYARVDAQLANAAGQAAAAPIEPDPV